MMRNLVRSALFVVAPSGLPKGIWYCVPMRAWAGAARLSQANAPQKIAANFLEVGCTGALFCYAAAREKAAPS